MSEPVRQHLGVVRRSDQTRTQDCSFSFQKQPRSPRRAAAATCAVGNRGALNAAPHATAMLNLGWSRSGAPELWKVLDEATRVAETKLKDPKAWWEDMGHAGAGIAAGRPLPLADCGGSADSQRPYLRNRFQCGSFGHHVVAWNERVARRV